MSSFTRLTVLSSVLFLFFAVCSIKETAAQELRTYNLGECALESGEVIEECVIAYRTVGELNANGSNAVLLTTWGSGTSEQKLAYVGPDGWVDPDRHFVIVVDAFGNGVSSSPSNSRTQPGDDFPQVTIRDMVRAQHRLLTEELELNGLHGVAGISLGGMQVFEWATTFPDFIGRVVPVVATPRVSAHDLLVWNMIENLHMGSLFEDCGAGCKDHARETALTLFTLMLRTPGHWDRILSRDDVPGFLEQVRDRAQYLSDTYDALTRIRAVILMDVSEPFGGSMERAANAVEAEMLVVVNDPDLLTAPGPSRRFAGLAGARLLETDSDCGHQAVLNACAGEEITAAIREFLW